MPFEVETTEIESVLLLRPRVHPDHRGAFLETYRSSDFARLGVTQPFVQDNLSISRAGVLRGLHFQRGPRAQTKLVSCVAGRIWCVAVDLRQGSPTWSAWVARELDPVARAMMLVPAGFAHGFLAMREDTAVSYKCTAEYDVTAEGGVRWNDPDLAIPWPVSDPILSAKDAVLPLLRGTAPAGGTP